MPEELLIPNSGLQTVVPQLAAPQYVFLDFDGAVTSYRNRDLDILIDGIQIDDSGFDSETITLIVAALNDRFGDGIVFTADLPQTDDYSTVYVGTTRAFDAYGHFLGLAETIDVGNQIRNDNAFVFLNSAASLDTVVYAVAHETEHIVYGMEHGGEGLERYAADIYVKNGAVSNGLTVSSGTTMHVSSGGTANVTIVSGHSANMHVSSGGTAIATTVTSGSMYVCSGGTANSTTVNRAGKMHVLSGGTASGTLTRDYGSIFIFSGGTASATTMNGGDVFIYNGGVANGATVNGGFLNVPSGGTANSTTVNGGDLNVSSGGTANSTTVNGGKMLVSNGGTATDIDWTPCVGSVYVEDGAYATFVSQYKGCYFGSNDILLSSGMTLENKIVSGSMYVFASGTANNTTVNGSGYMCIFSGGTALNIDWTPCVGSVYVEDGAYATFVSQYKGCYLGSSNALLSSGMTLENKIVSGSMYVFASGTAYSTTVSRGGRMYVSSGGTVNATTVNSSGYLHIFSGGTANATTVNSSGTCTSLAVARPMPPR